MIDAACERLGAPNGLNLHEPFFVNLVFEPHVTNSKRSARRGLFATDRWRKKHSCSLLLPVFLCVLPLASIFPRLPPPCLGSSICPPYGTQSVPTLLLGSVWICEWLVMLG